MPSLRRTLSSPSVRSSPYSYSSSSSPNVNGHATRAANPQPRRSSGSDTHSRRVLADLDWWIVQDGQRELAGPSGAEPHTDDEDTAENENDQVRPLDATIVSEDSLPVLPPTVAQATTAGSTPGGFESERLSNPLWDVSTDSSYGSGSPQVMSPLPQFAALSLGPRTPLRRHSSESSQSSLDSTPDSVPGSPFLPTYMDILRPAAPLYPSLFASSITARRPGSRPPAIASRSVSYSAVEFQLSSTRFHDDRFEDIVPSPPPFFSSTMDDSDMDDLFY